MERKEITKTNTVRVAIVGCLHGCLKDVYDAIEADEEKTGKKVDLLLCCGDFESVRDKNDLKYKACPEKYKHMGQFQYYYNNSQNEAKVLTIFVGGNHEASNVLDQNFYGGWIAKNIFYLGRAGVVKYKGLRIAGISGIYKNFDYFKGHFETDLIKNIKSIYHVREFEIAKMSHLTGEIDFLMTHDWPTGVVDKKDFNKILKIKKFWKQELMTDTLGSPASAFLMKLLKPKYLLSGHMHYTYFNTIYHNDNKRSNTKFIALDKAGTKKDRCYLHIMDYDVGEGDTTNVKNDDDIYFDEEWMAITKAFNPFIPLRESYVNLSNFVVKREDYVLAIKDCYNYIWKNKTNFVYPNEEFYKNITNFANEFYSFGGGKIPWPFLNEGEQRGYVTKLIGIEDYHKAKSKGSYGDKSNSGNYRNYRNYAEQNSQDLNIYNKSESKKQENKEEIDLDIEF